MKFSELAAEPIGRNQTLNPKIWQDGRVRPEVRAALLKIAQDFEQFIDVPIQVEDIIIAGAQANLTYSEYSDLDLHLVVDYSTVDCAREAAELFDSKRLLFKEKHRIEIRGIPVEPGVEDLRNPTVSAAYSLIKNQWLREPQKTPPEYDRAEVERWTDIWTRMIQAATQSQSLPAARSVLKLLRKYRKLGLSQPRGEFSIPNLVYKSLRNSQDIADLQHLVDRLHDQELSVK